MTKRKNPQDCLPGGQPTLFREEYIDQAYKYCLLGATDERLAQFFDVSITTIDNWKNAHPKFFGALKAGREVADANVGKSLYERACGYSHPSEEIKVVNGEVVKVPIIKQYPPDTAAAIIWLKNRQPKLWREKQQEENEDKSVHVHIHGDEAALLKKK